MENEDGKFELNPWMEQVKNQVDEVKKFIETNAKEHPALFFAGAVALGMLASKPRMLGLIGRSALGFISVGSGLKVDAIKDIWHSLEEKIESSVKSVQSTAAAKASDVSDSVTHH